MKNARSAVAFCIALAVMGAPLAAMADSVHQHAVSSTSTQASKSAAPSNTHRVVVNGKSIAPVALFEDRLYVPASAFAAAIGGTLENANGIASIKLPGRDLPTLPELTAMNPALATYQPLSPYIPGMGIHMGVPGPSLILATSNEGTLNAVEVMVPAEQGWQPWFDQPKDQPMEMPGVGQVYTQHIYLTDPAGLVEQEAGVPVIIGGRYLSTGYNLKAHKLGDALHIPLRPAVELLGGTITWEGPAMTATATVDFKGVTYGWMKELNPALTKYEPLSEFVPNMGIHHGVPGPHVTVLTDTAGMVVGFELVVPAVAGWQPWFDQPKNQPMELPGLGQVYTQHIYLVDPSTIK